MEMGKFATLPHDIEILQMTDGSALMRQRRPDGKFEVIQVPASGLRGVALTFAGMAAESAQPLTVAAGDAPAQA